MPPKSKVSIAWPALLLSQTGDISAIQIKTTGPLTLAAIQTHLKKKKGIECIATYKAKIHGTPHTLFLFGAQEGPEDQQNQHTLPPPHDSTGFFGDILLVASKDPKSFEAPTPFSTEQYEEFYTQMFSGGYESDEDELNEIVDDVEADVDTDAAEEDEEEEEAEEEEEEEAEAEAEAEVEAEEDEPARKMKAKKKKAAASAAAAAAKNTAAIFSGSVSAYPSPPILSEDEQLQEKDTTQTPERARVLRGLRALFANHLKEPELVSLEQAIYNGAIHEAKKRHIVRCWTFPLFAHLYTMRALSVSSNLSPESYVKNADLFDSHQKGEISFEAIGSMNSYELFPSRWREMFSQQAIREKKQLEGNKDRATDQFTCTRCWKKECTYYEMQTRSADEPMTIFITCLNCGKKWRQ